MKRKGHYKKLTPYNHGYYKKRNSFMSPRRTRNRAKRASQRRRF